MKDMVDVFVMDGTYCTGTYGNAERFEVPYVGDIAVINYQVRTLYVYLVSSCMY